MDVESRRREKDPIRTFKTKGFQKLLKMSYRERRTHEFVIGEVTRLAGKQEPLLATVKRRKMIWFGHVNRHNTLSKTILQGTVEGKRKRGRQKKNWSSNIREWMDDDLVDLTRATEDRRRWRKLSLDAALKSPQRPRSRDT
eukprot:GHVO01032804.1.p1 GENE.GHVO01032804.1~~GHVO01032804.1.p1  ORF type:complete len:141 (-),score=18.55 GHVO01032804.1:365-787(-)